MLYFLILSSQSQIYNPSDLEPEMTQITNPHSSMFSNVICSTVYILWFDSYWV